MYRHLPHYFLVALLIAGPAALSLSAQESFVPGFLKYERYTDIGGTAVNNLTGDPKYPDSPDEVQFLGSGFTLPNGIGDNYGARVTGFVIPPSDGDYHFYIRSDDASQLFISTDDNPANLGATPIAEETACCNSFQDVGAAQTSAAISLVAGQQYYIMALLKEGGGGDWMEVAWAQAGEPTPADGQVIPAENLGTLVDTSQSNVTIEEQPQDTTIEENTQATFSVSATGNPQPINYQWQKNGEDIAGATDPTYTTPVLSLDEDGALYQCVVTVPGATVTSDEAMLTVTVDMTPPTVESVGSLQNPDGSYQVSVVYSELIDPDTAGDMANFSLSGGTIDGIEFYQNSGEHLPDRVSEATVLTVSGLTAGTEYTLEISGVLDRSTEPNAIETTSIPFTASDMTYTDVGAPLEPGEVTSVGQGGFDIMSSGRTQWATYDETTIVYKEAEGDFNFRARLIDQDFSSQWARAGLMFREELNAGAEEGSEPFSRNMTMHANPEQDRNNDGTFGVGNNGYESNFRLEAGGETDGVGAGTPLYPNAWVRLQRIGDVITGFRSDDGENWTLHNEQTFENLASTLFIGPAFSPETLNIGDNFTSTLFLAQIRNFAELPLISSVPANGTVFADPAQGLEVRIRTGTGVDPENINLTLNGADRTADAEISGDETDQTLTLSPLEENTIYTVVVDVIDNAGIQVDTTINFDTFSQDNFIFEAEDFNFEGGQFFDDPILCDILGGADNCYFDRVGVEGIDEHDIDGGGPTDLDTIYRFGPADAQTRQEAVGTEIAGDFLRQKYVDAGIPDYNVGWVAVGEWLNYTRTFPTGEFNVYARLARDGDVMFANELSWVTSDPTQSNQTTEPIGTFAREGTGGWQNYVFVPLRDENGDLAVVEFDGEATLRSTATEGGYNANFYMLTPAVEDPGNGDDLVLTIERDGTGATLSWMGTATLESADAVEGPYTEVTDATSPHDISLDGETQFYRLRQ